MNGCSRMTDFDFPADIPIDSEHTLEQLTGRFQGVKDGLPELIKNAKDQYSRLGINEANDRQIVVVVNTDQKTIGVIDFAGAGPEDFSGWMTWSSRTGGQHDLGSDIEAGHGNGGKAFMVRGSNSYSYLDSCANGKRTKMGFRNDMPKEKYKPGYARINGTLINDVSESTPGARLQEVFYELGHSVTDLPPPCADTFNIRNAFTAAVVDRVRDWDKKRKATINRLARELPEQLGAHGQAALTIDTCSVWVIVDGGLITTTPIKKVPLDPHPGFENLQPIGIPQTLTDPGTGDKVDTGIGDEATKFLNLQTSKKHLQISEELKGRNVIRIWNERNNVATWSLPSLGVMIPTVSFIHGVLRCPSLTGEHHAGADRTHLSDTPLVRALHRWVVEQVGALAELIQQAQMAENKPKDREKANQALHRLRELMRKFLEPEESGGYADDDAGGGEDDRDNVSSGSRVDEIDLEPYHSNLAIAIGTKAPLIYRCYEQLSDGKKKPVRDVTVRLGTNPENLATLNNDGMLVAQTQATGEIWLETSDGSVRSNSVTLEVLECTGADILVPNEPLLQGQRLKLRLSFHTPSGPRDDLLIDGKIDEPGMALLGRFGWFTAGLSEGVATIRVRYGPAPPQQVVEKITIGSERVPVKGTGGDTGGDVPVILLCGEEAPGLEEYPQEQRTHGGGEQHPTIIEEPQFRNVVWINPNSKEAMRVRASRGGPSGVGGVATANFMHFIALKCFDILKRLWVRQQIREQSVNELEFVRLFAQAEMECSEFIDAAWEISDDLLKKTA